MTTTFKSPFQSTVPNIFLSMSNIHNLINDYGIDRKLMHLVMLRASQINQCGYCVEMHTREAREDGESSERLDSVIVFKQMNCFEEKEKLALEWTEALTSLRPEANYEVLRNKLLGHFGEKEVSALTALIGMINVWNRVRISEHKDGNR